MNFKQMSEEDYSYIHVGSWDNSGLKMDDEEIWANSSAIIRSVCSDPCEKAQIKVKKAVKQSLEEKCVISVYVLLLLLFLFVLRVYVFICYTLPFKSLDSRRFFLCF